MTEFTWTDSHSYKALFVFFLVIFTVFFGPVLRYDGIRYVSPARSLLIDYDLNTYNESAYYAKPGWKSIINRTRIGKSVAMLKYVNAPEYTTRGYKHVVFPIGNSLTWLIPMTISHAMMKSTGNLNQRFLDDGFSPPYIISLGFFSFFLAFTGSIFAYKILRFWYLPFVSIAAVIFGVAAGNIILFFTQDVAFSHSIDYFLINLILLLVLTGQKSGSSLSGKTPDWSLHSLIGFVCGWAIIVRYQDVFLLLLPLTLYLLDYFSTRQKQWKNWLGFIAAFSAVIMLQVIYWEILYGTVFISGNLLGTGGLPSFTPTHPQILQMLFSRFHGLFSWMPYLLPVSITSCLFIRRERRIGIILLIIMVIQIYYNASRTEWWNLGFSVRRFSGWSIYFMIGMAELICLIKSRWSRILLGFTILAGIFWHWLFMIHFGLNNVKGSIYPDLIQGLGPYGNPRFGFIIPSIHLVVQGIRNLDIWFLRHTWFGNLIRWKKNGYGSVALVYVACIFLLFVFMAMLLRWIEKGKTINYRSILIGLVCYITFSAILLISTDCFSKVIVAVKAGDCAGVMESQNIRVNAGHCFLGESDFVSLSDKPICINNVLHGTKKRNYSLLIGIPLMLESDVVSIELASLKNGTSVFVKEVILDKNSLDCRKIDKPWGNVLYANNWYQLNLKMDDVDWTADKISLRVITGKNIILAAASQDLMIDD